eukprot:GAHX01001715.1.p1 GENE.GAHX01001715.1~~GAHX01001715.1.p1  ORF type:complete len:426 (-),score=81.53 GAHX01001715.1:93-1370(-)
MQATTHKASSLINKLPTYESNRYVIVKSTRVAIIYWALVIVIAGGSFAAFILQGGYYKKNDLQGSVTISLIGSGYTLSSQGSESSYKKIQDSVDLRFPAVEVNAVTIVSSSAIIYNQNRQKGSGSSLKANSCDSELLCKSDSDCTNKTYSVGNITGKCSGNSRCIIEGWCPALFPTPELVEGLDKNLKLKLKINAFFKEKDKQHNEMDVALEEILMKSGQNYGVVQKEGALFLARLVYNCYLNNRADCTPTLNVIRLDNTAREVPSGFKVYDTTYNKPKNAVEDNKDFYYRDLKDIRGVRIIFAIDGSMNETSIELLLLGIGAAFGLVGLASTMVEKLIQYVLTEGKEYMPKISVDLDEEKRHIEQMCRRVVENKLAEYGASLNRSHINDINNKGGNENVNVRNLPGQKEDDSLKLKKELDEDDW